MKKIRLISKIHCLYYLAGIILILSFTATAANLQREQRIIEQIQESILDGEPVWLELEGHRFFAIYTQASTDQTLGGVILLHGMGANPDWTDVIHPLRVGLPDQGWDTLSIQLPVADSGADSDDYLPLISEAFPRIQKAIEFYTQNQNTNLILIDHSLGARVGLEFLSQDPQDEIQAFVAIGLSAPQNLHNNPVLDAISQLGIPMLDLYGSCDLTTVVQSAKARKVTAIRAGNATYRQTVVEGANHFFHSLDDTLQVQVADWLRRMVTDSKVNVPADPSPSAP